MVFFGEEDSTLLDQAVSVAREQICKHIDMPVADFVEDTIAVHIDMLVVPWTITFLIKRHGKMIYEVKIDPAALM